MSNPLDQIAPGCDVAHEVFGHGVILEYAAPFELAVRFDDDEVGDRRIHLSFAPVVISCDGIEIKFRDALPEETIQKLTPHEEAMARLDAVGSEHRAVASKAIDTATDERPAQLVGLVLDKVDFSGRRLVGTNFASAHLRNALFAGADLTGANFTGADMEFADLSGCELAGADFSNAVLTDAEFRDANLAGADLTGIFASLIGFADANLSMANLSGASLTAADFTGADLQGASLLNAEIEEADFDDANLNGTTMPDGSIHE
jgi:uncharacterized protein YjbI with pentapeptide repeats